MIRLILSKRVPFFVSDLRRDQNAEALCSVIEGKRKILTLVCADTALTQHYYAQDVSLLTQGKHIGLSRIGNELVEGSIGLWFRCASNEWSTFEAFEEALGNFLRSFVAKHNL